jgi:DNA-binding NtrC family response regulator
MNRFEPQAARRGLGGVTAKGTPMAEQFSDARRERRTSPARVHCAARARLVAHAFPGHVRELGNRVQRATVVAAGNEITFEDLGLTEDVRCFADHAERPHLRSGSPRDDDAEEHRKIEADLTHANGVVSLQRWRWA